MIAITLVAVSLLGIISGISIITMAYCFKNTKNANMEQKGRKNG